ncbi:MAG TPA: hypothetical protein VIU45_06585, partial [Chitinophagaceae bacterium]
MWNKKDIKYFRKTLLEWFDSNGREFPWREKGISNYELILCEILLQRTKAETVSKYYNVFFKKYPTWDNLIEANIYDLEKILKPLGLYKHRAKRIFKIIQEYKEKNGILPQNKNELQESNLAALYISNSYELFILNHRAALLDVNMSRVLSRYFYPQEFKDVRNDKIIQGLANNVINVKSCKELNWAILDYAALVCKSSKPACQICKLNTKCRFYELSKTNDIEGPRLNIRSDAETPLDPDKPLKVVSLFSGCGGMDLGFEGDFTVHKDSVNEILNPEYIEKAS